MTKTERTYEETLVAYFEEEIEGEAYFHALAEHFDEPGAAEKLHLMAEVERCAANTMLPLLARHGLKTCDEGMLREHARTRVGRDSERTWAGFVEHVADFYPTYIDDFEALEAMAPQQDLNLLERLTLHEHVTIDFAKLERDGVEDSSKPMRDYVALCDGKPAVG